MVSSQTTQTQNISVLCSSKGRTFLPTTVESWLSQSLVEGDKLIILADGVQIDDQWDSPFVEVRLLHKVGTYGNKHRANAIEAGLPTSYYTLLDDDDVYLPGAIEMIRPYLDGFPVAHPLLDGLQDGTQLAFDVANGLPGSSFRVLLPNSKLITWLLPGWSDALFMQNACKPFGECRTFFNPLSVSRAPLLSKEKWLELDLPIEFDPEWAKQFKGRGD